MPNNKNQKRVNNQNTKKNTNNNYNSTSPKMDDCQMCNSTDMNYDNYISGYNKMPPSEGKTNKSKSN